MDLRVDLYQLLGAAVGYDHTVDYIKNQIYQPQYHVGVELEPMQIRTPFAKAITDDGLKVIVQP
jgi:predicted phosphoadenosine phosphosulfate sulfurtransferase